jgi:hypothetical protein
VLGRSPAAVAIVGACGALIAWFNCLFILAGGVPAFVGRSHAIPSAIVGFLFAVAALRAWSAVP